MICHQCTKDLDPLSDSENFCDELCQRLWNEKNPLAGFGISMRQVEEALEVAAPVLQAAGWSAAAVAPTEPVPPLEVVADAPTQGARPHLIIWDEVSDPTPKPGWVLRVLRRWFG